MKTISDDTLLRDLFEILRRTRHDEADLVAHIAEVDARKLYARQAASSMFVWCTERLRLSEQGAYLRIAVARASREHPMLLAMLREGRLHLSGMARLVPHLTRENREAVLKRAEGISYRQVKELVRELEPKPDAPARIRKLPQPSVRTSTAASSQLWAPIVERAANESRLAEVASPGGVGGRGGPDGPGREFGAHPVPPFQEGSRVPGQSAHRPAPPRRGTVEPLAPARFKVEFTASVELRDKLERLQALMRSSVPDGDLGRILEQAVTEKLERLEAKRFGKTKKPRRRLADTDTTPKSRHIPAAVRRFVEERDGGRCTYRDKHGKRCSKRHDLEFHHRKPFACGGEHSPEVVCLMCRTHNALMAEEDFGKEKMARHSRRARLESGVVHVDVREWGPVGAAVPGTGPADADAPRAGRVNVEVARKGPGEAGLRARWRSSGASGRPGVRRPPGRTPPGGR